MPLQKLCYDFCSKSVEFSQSACAGCPANAAARHPIDINNEGPNLEINTIERAEISISESDYRLSLVDDSRVELVEEIDVKVDYFDFCTRISDDNAFGEIMLARGFEEQGNLCFFVHREGYWGVFKIRVPLAKLQFLPTDRAVVSTPPRQFDFKLLGKLSYWRLKKR